MAETSPSSETDFEPLLRRFIPQAGSTAIPATAFRPNPKDITGISVSFEKYPNPIDRVLARTNRPPSDYSVCRFDLSDLPQLSVVAAPEPDDEGHATIPEIAPPYQELAKSDARKIQLKEWQEELVRRSNIIHHAGDPI